MSRAREFANLAGSADAGGLTGRNLIINGAMQVAQRSTSTSTSYGYQTVDRFQVSQDNLDNIVMQQSQSTESPDGFSNSFKIEVTTAETALESNEAFYFQHRIEAQNLQHLQFGTSNAKSMTLSFWVRSSVTGTYAIDMYKADTTARNNVQTYTINSADTWEYKTLHFAGDTDSGATIANDNGIGITLYCFLSAGSSISGGDASSWAAYGGSRFASGHTADFAAQTGTFYITGMQLEVGDEATPFEHRSFGEELALCQRYLCKSAIYSDAPANSTPYNGGCIGGSTSGYNSTTGYTNFTNYPVSMRAKPTITIYSPNLSGNADGKASVYDGGWGSATTSVLSNSEIGHALNIVDSWTAHNTIMYFYAYKAEAEL